MNAFSAWNMLASDLADSAAQDATELPERGLAALVLIKNHPGCSVDWLHLRLGITQSGTVRLVDRLERLGLIVRQRTPGRREVALQLDASGEERLRRGLGARAAAIRSLLVALEPEERSQLAELIGKALVGGRRTREQADVACRLCDWGRCEPYCPVDASVIDESHTG